MGLCRLGFPSVTQSTLARVRLGEDGFPTQGLQNESIYVPSVGNRPECLRCGSFTLSVAFSVEETQMVLFRLVVARG